MDSRKTSTKNGSKGKKPSTLAVFEPLKIASSSQSEVESPKAKSSESKSESGSKVTITPTESSDEDSSEMSSFRVSPFKQPIKEKGKLMGSYRLP
jgi:hypothetical protein